MKILYAEDELPLSMAVTEILRMNDYEVESVYDGACAWEKLTQTSYDAVILDVMMPNMDGIQVLQKMREHQDYTPVLLLTAKVQTEDRISGLSSGADDYLGKPFSMDKLLARLHALLRRTNEYRVTNLKYGNISLNCDTNELLSNQGSLRLSSMETSLLSLILKQPEQYFAEKQLLEQLRWKDGEDDAIHLYISYLKTKLQQLHATIQIAHTEQGFALKKEQRRSL